MAVKKRRAGASNGAAHTFAVVVEDLRAQFKVFGEQLAGTNSKIDQLDTKIDAVDAKVEAVRGEVHDLRGEVQDLRGEMGFVKVAVLELAKDRRR